MSYLTSSDFKSNSVVMFALSSTMRHQQGSFAQAFSKHCERFGDDNEKAQKWREALKEVADLSAGAPRLQ
jgi:hypothetical protein